MFQRIVVIGAGTMGAGIAAQVANAGQRVLLLDLPEEGDPDARAARALKRLCEAEPPAFMHPDRADLVDTGNTRDDLSRVADADWVIEAVVERLEVKRALYRQLADLVPAHCVVTSNTSTIPIALLTEGLPDTFRARFAITHYFNPVRYMRLLELVQGEATDANTIDALAHFNDTALGKGVVHCRDTPGFLGNRVGVYALQVGMDETLKANLDVATADALLGRPLGIPKTGIFGLYDLIGIDLMADVVASLETILPPGDAFHAVGRSNQRIDQVLSALLREGRFGNKSGAGFYMRGAHGERLGRQLGTGEYAALPATPPALADAALAALSEQREGLVELTEGDDRLACFCRRVLRRVLSYAAGLLGEISDSPQAIDDAMKLGFNWERGPFEMIDAIGAARLRGWLKEAGEGIPPALSVDDAFYRAVNGEIRVRHLDKGYTPLKLPDGVVRFQLARRAIDCIERNKAASIYRVADGCLLVEFHSKANALSDDSMSLLSHAANRAAEESCRGIIVHNDAQHYSAGVDLNVFLAMIDSSDWTGIDAFLQRFQHAVTALRYCRVPVVGAPSGLALGGGFEVLLHCDSRIMHANTVCGLVESAVGLIPAGGGVKDTFRRWHGRLGNWNEAAWKTWQTVGHGKTASSPELAEPLCWFDPSCDRQVMNRDRLFCEAVSRIAELEHDYRPPPRPELRLADGATYDRMQSWAERGMAEGRLTPHDRTVAMALAEILCDASGAGRETDEDELFERERAAFVTLARTPESRARIAGLLGGSGMARN